MAIIGAAEALWGRLVATYDPYTIDFVGTLVVQFIFWWIPCVLFVSLDSIAPAFSERHKIQPAPKQPTASDIFHSVMVCIRNQVIVFGLHGALLYASFAKGLPPSIRVDAKFPSLEEFVRDLIVSVLVREALFYSSHRIFHWRPLYKRIHKTHHKFTAPVAFSSQYAHPVEHLVANVLPILLPPLFLKAHILTMWVFVAFQLIETSTVHSGYDFFGGAARKHDRHHERFDVYFGGIGLLDYVFGTDERESVRRVKKE
ncbi:sterol desaturase family [Trichoderma arundinaceum]|uniref:Sterol desaturase family n=1 Tax=Trichoderma arundinaceum TaxID=490622 RepID=A0A395NRH1_TRIAR|nr:sterol desaturase family [Trichoderma arundinaceum]